MATAWKRTSGARAIISTLKMKPAAAAPSVALTSRGPALRRVCSRDHDQEHSGGETAARGEGELGLTRADAGGAGASGSLGSWPSRGRRRRAARPSG